jgi:hypothetical protein
MKKATVLCVLLSQWHLAIPQNATGPLKITKLEGMRATLDIAYEGESTLQTCVGPLVGRRVSIVDACKSGCEDLVVRAWECRLDTRLVGG